MTVWVATPLQSYTGASRVEAAGATVAELLEDLDRRYPGIRFRMIDEQDSIRPHIKIFVDSEKVPGISAPVGGANEIHILCALSGG